MFKSFTVCSRTVNRQEILPCCKANFLLLIRAEKDELCIGVMCRRESPDWGSVHCCSSPTCQVQRPWWVLTGRHRADQLSLTSSRWRVPVVDGRHRVHWSCCRLVTESAVPDQRYRPCCCIRCCISVCCFSCRCFPSFQLALLHIAITYWHTLCIYYCVA